MPHQNAQTYHASNQVRLHCHGLRKQTPPCARHKCCAGFENQKLNFSANCITLGLTAVLWILPKVADEKLVSGSANCGWLNRLKNSIRNSTLAASTGQRTANVLITA